MSRLLAAVMSLVIVAACGDDEGASTSETDTSGQTETSGVPTPPSFDAADMVLTSAAFEDGETVPEDHTCDGADESPPLTWSDVPAGATDLVLIVDDADAPGGRFVHWVVWGLSAESTGLEEGELIDGVVEGTNGFGATGWRGPCPPPGDGPHEYRFRLLALSGPVDVEPGATGPELEAAIEDQVLAEGVLTAVYDRS